MERVRLLRIQRMTSQGGLSEEMAQTPLGNCSITTKILLMSRQGEELAPVVDRILSERVLSEIAGTVLLDEFPQVTEPKREQDHVGYQFFTLRKSRSLKNPHARAARRPMVITNPNCKTKIHIYVPFACPSSNPSQHFQSARISPPIAPLERSTPQIPPV
jgi:hypothetical protein